MQHVHILMNERLSSSSSQCIFIVKGTLLQARNVWHSTFTHAHFPVNHFKRGEKRAQIRHTSCERRAFPLFSQTTENKNAAIPTSGVLFASFLFFCDSQVSGAQNGREEHALSFFPVSRSSVGRRKPKLDNRIGGRESIISALLSLVAFGRTKRFYRSI